MAAISYSSNVRPSWHCFDVRPDPDFDFAAEGNGLNRLPRDISTQLRREFWQRWNADESRLRFDSVDWLAGEVGEFEREKLHLAFDDEELRQKAARCAELCSKMVTLEPMEDFARGQGIEPPVDKGRTRAGRANRLRNNHWWLYQLRVRYRRRAESHIRSVGIVNRRNQIYASDLACSARQRSKRKTAEWLRDCVVVSDEGDQLELFEVVAASQANPVLRRNELMVRLRGFDEVAQAAGHAGLFVTLTCPSAFHATLETGARNPRFKNFTPRDGQSWLCKMWQRARAKIDRLKILMYGFRVAEPHHDGTPHWHAVLFAPAHQIETISFVLRSYWLSEYADEPGATSVRVKFKKLDRAKGSAPAYLAKYIAKNIDGFEVGNDDEAGGEAAEETCHRVGAWASAHRIRQFQQIGGPPVTVWRELRRLRDAGVQPEIRAARAAADAGEWADFIAALGGIERGRGGAVQLWTEHTGELNQYGELRGPQIAGVRAWRTSIDSTTGAALGSVCVERCGSGVPVDSRHHGSESGGSEVRVRTRCKVWRIQRKAPGEVSQQTVNLRSEALGSRPVSPLGPVSITVRTTPAGNHRTEDARGSPWTH